jgi:NAD/ferredoxin-dependent reductase-like protein
VFAAGDVAFFSDQYGVGMEYSGYAPRWDEVVLRGDPAARARSSTAAGSPIPTARSRSSCLRGARDRRRRGWSTDGV